MVVRPENNNDISLMVGGEAGSGIQSAGRLFSLLCARAGLWVFGNAEYPSLIRGGHNFDLIRVAEREIGVHTETVNLLLAMNQETLDLHLDAVVKGGGVIYDQSIENYDFGRRSLTLFPMPLAGLAREFGQAEITKNMVGMGAVTAIVDLPLTLLNKVLQELLAKKGEETVKQNLAAAKAGYNFARLNFPLAKFPFKLRVQKKTARRMLLTGNDATCLGAIKAGVKMVAEYPMTPSSGVLHFMARAAKDYNIIVKQTEDELAAINMVIGAGWAGARAMTATSGGGFALMSEALGMAGMIEAPAVIYEGQRGGPSTGLPTRTEQSDLQFAIHASQGEFPRVVMAPGSHEELFVKTFEAFNLAEKYQLPVIILSDKHLAEGVKTVKPFKTAGMQIDRGRLVQGSIELKKLLAEGFKSADGGFLRYKIDQLNGVSPRTIPGQKGGRHRASTDEHTESGDLDESEQNRVRMQKKRMRKLEYCLKDLPAPALVGPAADGSFRAGRPFAAKEADITFISWGSTRDALLEVLQKLKSEGIKANLLQLVYFVPFHAAQVEKILKAGRFKVGVEMNYEGQMCNLVMEKTGIKMNKKILKWSGRQFTAQEIYRKTRQYFAKKTRR